MSAQIFHAQRGGSTLIGLLLGACLGMLTLIKWPYLERQVSALLAAHDISVTNELLQEVSASEGRSTQLEARPPQEITTSNGETPRSAIETQVAKHALVGQTSIQSGVEPTANIQGEPLPSESTKDAISAITLETREVWQPFSSESAAHAFRKAVLEALDIEVETIRRSDHKVVPIVRCTQKVLCDDIEAKIAAYLAGPANTRIPR